MKGVPGWYMDNKLFVGNLSWSAEEQDLQDLFAQVGSVQEVAIMRDKFTGKARGFAFVTMSTPDEAQEAIRRFEGQEFMGREMKVNIARPREDRPAPRGGGFGGGSRGGDRPRGGGGNFDRRKSFSRDREDRY